MTGSWAHVNVIVVGEVVYLDGTFHSVGAQTLNALYLPTTDVQGATTRCGGSCSETEIRCPATWQLVAPILDESLGTRLTVQAGDGSRTNVPAAAHRDD